MFLNSVLVRQYGEDLFILFLSTTYFLRYQGIKFQNANISLKFYCRVLSRKIYKGELEKKWPGPEELFDWDIWTRQDEQLKGRECIIPDISRTYHFGTKGLNVGSFMQAIYFQSHAFNKLPHVKLNPDVMYKDNYEKEMRRLVKLVTKAPFTRHQKTARQR